MDTNKTKSAQEPASEIKFGDLFVYLPTKTMHQCVGRDEGKVWYVPNGEMESRSFDPSLCSKNVSTMFPEQGSAPAEKGMDRESWGEGWDTAMTIANNLCIGISDDCNNDDFTEQADAANNCAKKIRAGIGDRSYFPDPFPPESPSKPAESKKEQEGEVEKISVGLLQWVLHRFARTEYDRNILKWKWNQTLWSSQDMFERYVEEEKIDIKPQSQTREAEMQGKLADEKDGLYPQNQPKKEQEGEEWRHHCNWFNREGGGFIANTVFRDGFERGVKHAQSQTREAKSDPYWKQRCEAAEKLLIIIHGKDVIENQDDYETWQSLKNR